MQNNKERDLQRNFEPSTTWLFASPGQFVNKICTPSHLFQVLLCQVYQFPILADLFQMSGKFSEMQGGDQRRYILGSDHWLIAFIKVDIL